jgi:hypothetical protein
VWYNSVAKLVQFDAYLVQNSWLFLGFGSSANNTDILFFSSNGTQMDMFSKGSDLPVMD